MKENIKNAYSTLFSLMGSKNPTKEASVSFVFQMEAELVSNLGLCVYIRGYWIVQQ